MVFLDFTSDWCGPSRVHDQTGPTQSDPHRLSEPSGACTLEYNIITIHAILIDQKFDLKEQMKY